MMRVRGCTSGTLLIGRRELLAASALLPFVPTALFGAAPRNFAGSYLGGFGTLSDFSQVDMTLDGTDAAPIGVTELPFRRPQSRPLRAVRVDGDRLRFETPGPRGSPLRFDLRRTAVGLGGTVRSGSRAYRADFARGENATAQQVAALIGNYDLGDGRGVTLAQSGSGYLWWREWPTGRLGVFWPEDADNFTTGPGFTVVAPERARFRVRRTANGNVAGLYWREHGRSEILAPRVSLYTEEEITFANGDVTLSGTLFRPPGAGPHPGVVLIHGSGAQTRVGSWAQIRLAADAYARSGIAVLTYDKRGAGRSTGNFDTSNFELLAGDAAAAVRLLQSLPGIRSDFVGMSGVSQAGWIMALATRQVPNARFCIPISGGGTNVRFQERRRIEMQMHADGFAQSDIDRALHLRDLRDDYATTSEGWTALESYYAQVRDEPWIPYQGELEARDSTDWAWLRTAFAYDVAPFWRSYRGSVFALMGEHDTLTPIAENRAALESALAAGGNPDYAITVLPGAGHNLWEAVTGGEREFATRQRFVAGYPQIVVDWVLARARLPRRMT